MGSLVLRTTLSLEEVTISSNKTEAARLARGHKHTRSVLSHQHNAQPLGGHRAPPHAAPQMDEALRKLRKPTHKHDGEKVSQSQNTNQTLLSAETARY